MLYSQLVLVYQTLEKTTKRLEKTKIITDFLKKVTTENISAIIALLQGCVFPQWDERKIGFSSRLMLKAIAKATGASTTTIEKAWNKTGDLGIVAAELSKKKIQATLVSHKLTSKKVLGNIRKLATLEGAGTVERKIGLVAELLTSAKPEEARFIVRTILEELRVGIAAGIIRDAIAQAYHKDAKEVEHAYDMLGDYGEVAERAKKKKLTGVALTPNRPVNAMLAILTKNVTEALEALGKPAQFEPKLDGFRLQLHKKKGEKIRLFTRRLEEVTRQFPEVVACAKTHVKAVSFILDAEAVSFDPKTGKHLPFQHISQRIKRKYHIEEMAKKLPVELNVFDVLFYNEKNLLQKPLKERRNILEKIIKNEKKKIKITEKLVTANVKEATQFFKKALAAGNEGVIIKNITAAYRPGRYVKGWCKLKQTLEPLDLVIVSALYGEGKRAKWFSSFRVACKKGSKFLEVGKVSTGVKEKAAGVTYKELTKLLKPLISSTKGREVIVKPKIVVEVGYEELQKSPTYTSGYAMRFPRVLRLRIKEKTAASINTVKDIERIYLAQKGKRH